MFVLYPDKDTFIYELIEIVSGVPTAGVKITACLWSCDGHIIFPLVFDKFQKVGSIHNTHSNLTFDR